MGIIGNRAGFLGRPAGSGGVPLLMRQYCRQVWSLQMRQQGCFHASPGEAAFSSLLSVATDDRGWLTGWGLLPFARKAREEWRRSAHGLAKDFQAVEQFFHKRKPVDDIYDGILPPRRSRR